MSCASGCASGGGTGPFAEPLDGPFVTRLAELASAHATRYASAKSSRSTS